MKIVKNEIRFKVEYQGLPCEVFAKHIDSEFVIQSINVEGDCFVLLEDLDIEARQYFLTQLEIISRLSEN
jgi:hypothetical protein